MECRQGCGACCIAPSISSAIPGMPDGKPAGVPCVQLDARLGCKIWPARAPGGVQRFCPMQDVCGYHREEAIWLIGELERMTA
ncbi:YkgJ family cysteine cluster protein [Aeromonas sp. 80P]